MPQPPEALGDAHTYTTADSLDAIWQYGDPYDAEHLLLKRSREIAAAIIAPLFMPALGCLSMYASYGYSSGADRLLLASITVPYFVTMGTMLVGPRILSNSVNKSGMYQEDARETHPTAEKCDFIRNDSGDISVRYYGLDGLKTDVSTPSELMQLYGFAKKNDIAQVIIGFDGISETIGESRTIPTLGYISTTKQLIQDIKKINTVTYDDVAADERVLVTNVSNLPKIANAIREVLGISLTNELTEKILNPKVRAAYEAYTLSHDYTTFKSSVAREMQATVDGEMDQMLSGNGRYMQASYRLHGNRLVTQFTESNRTHARLQSMASIPQFRPDGSTTKDQLLSRYIGYDSDEALINAAIDNLPDTANTEVRNLAALYVYITAHPDEQIHPNDAASTEFIQSQDTAFMRMFDKENKDITFKHSEENKSVAGSIFKALTAACLPAVIVLGAHSYTENEFSTHKAATIELWNNEHPGTKPPIEIQNMRKVGLGTGRTPTDLHRSLAYKEFVNNSQNPFLRTAAVVDDAIETMYRSSSEMLRGKPTTTIQNEQGAEEWGDSYEVGGGVGDVPQPDAEKPRLAFSYTMLNNKPAPTYWMSDWSDTVILEGGDVRYQPSGTGRYIEGSPPLTVDEALANNPSIVVESTDFPNQLMTMQLAVPEGYRVSAAFFKSTQENQAPIPALLIRDEYSNATTATIESIAGYEDNPAFDQLSVVYYLEESQDPLVSPNVEMNWRVNDKNIPASQLRQSSQELLDTQKALTDYFGVSPGAISSELIGERVREKPYSYTPLKDSGMHQLIDDGVVDFAAKRASLINNLAQLEAENCNTAATTVGALTNFSDGNSLIATGFYEPDNDGKLTFPGHMWGMEDGSVVDYTPAGAATTSEISTASITGYPTTTIQSWVASNNSGLQIFGGSLAAMAIVGLGYRKRRQIVNRFDRIVVRAADKVDTSAAQATINAVAWGPPGMLIPNAKNGSHYGQQIHDHTKPISARELLRLAKQEGKDTSRLSFSTLATIQAMKIADASRRRVGVSVSTQKDTPPKGRSS